MVTHHAALKNIMIVTIQKATILTGKSRSTIERHIKNGRLSKSGDGIDTTELLRVYGAFIQAGDVSHETSNDNAMTHREQWLMRQIEELKRDHQERERQYLEREKRLMALLTHQEETTSTAKKQNSLFLRIFKR
jgi:hypothetical protein